MLRGSEVLRCEESNEIQHTWQWRKRDNGAGVPIHTLRKESEQSTVDLSQATYVSGTNQTAALLHSKRRGSPDTASSTITLSSLTCLEPPMHLSGATCSFLCLEFEPSNSLQCAIITCQWVASRHPIVGSLLSPTSLSRSSSSPTCFFYPRVYRLRTLRNDGFLRARSFSLGSPAL